MICPAETPEGAACGLVKNLALMAFVSVGSHPSYLISVLEDFGVEKLDDMNQLGTGKHVRVFVNGNWYGTHSNADDLVSSILKLRRKHEIPKEIAIVRDILNKEVRFYTDSGRVQRPLFIVENGKIKLKKDHIRKMVRTDHEMMNFDETLKTGLIEFLDVEEEETAMIAMHISDLQSKKNIINTYTHCEIHPSMILGVCASIIPFPDHNQVRKFNIIYFSLLETLIRVLWASKLWEFTLAITQLEWILWLMYCITPKSHLLPQNLWIFFTSKNYPQDAMLWLL